MEGLRELIRAEREKVEAGVDSFLEEPVDVEEFIESTDYLGNERDNWIWPSVKEDLIETFQKDHKGNWKYHEVVLDEGIRSGKGEFASLAICYKTYLMLNWRDPQSHYHLSPEARPTVMNISIRESQAIQVVYSKIRGKIERCKWFKNHKFVPDKNIKSEIKLPKEVHIIPGSSTDTSAIGYDLFAAVIDEAAWLIDLPGHDVAEEHYNQLQRRLKNTFPEDWLLIMISSPRYVDDFIERKLEESLTNPKILGKRRPTWKAQPKERYCGEVFSYPPYDDIPIEYKVEFDRDPSRALRDLGAIPSQAIQPFFEEYERVLQNVNPNREDPLPLKESQKGKYTPESPLEQYNRLPEGFHGGIDHYYIHIDLSLNKDRAGFCIGHNNFNRGGMKATIDLMTAFIAYPGKEIDFEEIRQFIQLLKDEKGFKNIKLITLDQFQSADFRQIMINKGYTVERLSVQLAEFQTMKSMIYEGRLDYYKHPLFFNELKRLEQIKGNKVDHAKNSSSDIVDAVAGVCKHLAMSRINRPRPKGFRGKVVRGVGASSRGKTYSLFYPVKRKRTYVE